ncbi:YihY/virulence factor BrkB family protein [Aureimonas psammosilenae]|uniref:YihY/virulence factor BrkB family protein n=1 Tax=Aureimonas psammosilenae TaxID=2495496 RepID=UPI00186A6CE5|nr:YihY/virulence factor BrkB family protein [Aureimonas psammosilenae]
MALRFGESGADEMRRRAGEPGRGRDASGPFGIPAKGWRDIGLRLYNSFFEDRVMLIAAGATFYLLLAMFPAFAVFVSLYGFIADPHTISEHIAFIGQFLPAAGTDLLHAQLERLVTQDTSTLSRTFVIGLVIALWSANNGIKTLFEAMNVAYGEQEKRNFFKLNLLAFCFTLGAVAIGILLIVSVGVVPAVMALLGLSSVTDVFIASMRWPVMFLLVVGSIALVYRFGPSRNPARWRWVLFGAMLTSVVWIVTSIAFSWYLQNLANYSATYGSLGAAIGFMVWLWISSIIFVLGAEINAEMEHQTALDTTDAPAKPIGTRGARVADTIGRSSARASAKAKATFDRFRSRPST